LGIGSFRSHISEMVEATTNLLELFWQEFSKEFKCNNTTIRWDCTFVDMDGIVDHNYSNFLFIIITLDESLLTITVSKWLLFNANSGIFQLHHGENKLIFNEMIMRSAFILLAHWTNSPLVDILLHSDTLFRFRDHNLCSFSLMLRA
jgi:hypothetical protein